MKKFFAVMLLAFGIIFSSQLVDVSTARAADFYIGRDLSLGKDDIYVSTDGIYRADYYGGCYVVPLKIVSSSNVWGGSIYFYDFVNRDNAGKPFDYSAGLTLTLGVSEFGMKANYAITRKIYDVVISAVKGK